MAALAQRVHHVGRRHRLLARVLGVRRAGAHHVLDVRLQHAAHLLVDLAGDALHAATASHAADGAAGDAADVVAQHLLLALLAPLGVSGTLAVSAARTLIEIGEGQSKQRLEVPLSSVVKKGACFALLPGGRKETGEALVLVQIGFMKRINFDEAGLLLRGRRNEQVTVTKANNGAQEKETSGRTFFFFLYCLCFSSFALPPPDFLSLNPRTPFSSVETCALNSQSVRVKGVRGV